MRLFLLPLPALFCGQSGQQILSATLHVCDAVLTSEAGERAPQVNRRSLAGLGGVQGGHEGAEEGGQLVGRRRLERAHQLLVRRHLLLRDLRQH